MSNITLNQLSQEDMEYDGFFDGQNLLIADNTELEVVVIDGFCGIEEGKSKQVCMINVSVTTPGEFYGQKYRYNAKIYDMDANKRDLAMRNLGVLDAQAGFPMTSGQLELTTENIQECWANISEARVKFGLFVTDPEEEADGQAREINFVRGFGYLREKMVQAGGNTQAGVKPKQVQQEESPLQNEAPQEIDDDIDF